MERTITDTDLKLAVPLAVELALQPPRSKDDLQRRVEARPEPEHIKRAAVWLAIAMLTNRNN